MNIGERIKEERERIGLDQVEFSALGGASRHSQIDWEKGKSFPNAKALAAWAAAGVDVQYILTGVRAGGAIAHPTASYTVLAPDEAALVDHYRHIEDKEDKSAVMKLAMRSADAAAKQGTTQSRTKKAG